MHRCTATHLKQQCKFTCIFLDKDFKYLSFVLWCHSTDHATLLVLQIQLCFVVGGDSGVTVGWVSFWNRFLIVLSETSALEDKSSDACCEPYSQMSCQNVFFAKQNIYWWAIWQHDLSYVVKWFPGGWGELLIKENYLKNSLLIIFSLSFQSYLPPYWWPAKYTNWYLALLKTHVKYLLALTDRYVILQPYLMQWPKCSISILWGIQMHSHNVADKPPYIIL